MQADHLQNHVLRQLAASDATAFARLSNELQAQPIERGHPLETSRSPAEWVYFVESGIISLLASTRAGQSVEVALVGREGVVGIMDVLGDQPLPYALVVQLSGLAYRAPRTVIRAHILECTALHTLLMNYSQWLMHQVAQSVVCARFHTAVQRLARWLLLTADRADTNRFEITHEAVAAMVGAPRSAVSEAAAALREQGVIDYRRGVLTIRDAQRLQRVACECYESIAVAASVPSAGETEKPAPRKAPA